jgi:hypothetical protein
MWRAERDLVSGQTFAPSLYRLGATLEEWASASRLTDEVVAELGSLTQQIDQQLQADGHHITHVLGRHRAFNEGYVESTLLRSMVADAVRLFERPIIELANGGCEVVIEDGDRHLIFRLKKAERDSLGLRVLASSDSIFCREASDQASFFPTLLPQEIERWVLALVFDKDNLYVESAVAARPIGFRASRPGRLIFDAQIAVPFGRPEPPRFDGDEDDLELPDDDEGQHGNRDVG